MPAFLIGIALIAIGLWRLRAAKKYEFEHRTSGGVVQFGSFGAAQWHGVKKTVGGIAVAVGGLLLMIGIFWIGLAPNHH